MVLNAELGRETLNESFKDREEKRGGRGVKIKPGPRGWTDERVIRTGEAAGVILRVVLFQFINKDC